VVSFSSPQAAFSSPRAALTISACGDCNPRVRRFFASYSRKIDESFAVWQEITKFVPDILLNNVY